MVADLAVPQSETRGDVVTYTFSNGLTVRAETGGKKDRLRILPLTRLQGALLNHLMNRPALADGKRVLEPFAGSGAFGFMSLALGARHVDLVDVNPRAEGFHRETTTANGFPPDAVRSVTEDLRTFTASAPYDLILANPPFLPTPDCVEGTLNSNGGPEGNTLADALLERLPELLAPSGEALLILYQLAKDGVPLVARSAREHGAGRGIEFTPLQETPIRFEEYVEAYASQHPQLREGIARWSDELTGAYGPDLTLSHYVLHIGPRGEGPGALTVTANATQKYGSSYVIAAADPDYTPVDGRRR
ncbi:methyltransferase [Streptomyces avermitilis]|uniref:methyltransferase n=1 Tax=Streptomyces avermitilis TaxID=33903 RepID=UPI0033A862B6